MRDRARPSLFAVVFLAAIAAWVAAGLGSSTPVSAKDNGTLVATSVCEAHELRERQQKDPSLKIDLGDFKDMQWPTRAACLSHAAAEDPDTPGPVQPIQFSHKHHAGLYQIDCQYCHSGTDRSPSAGVPALEVCMGCHAQFPASYDELEGIKTLKQHWANKQPIEWVQIHRLPEYVQFQHRVHVQKGITCQQCHGAVETLDKLSLTPDTKWWPWLLPTAKLEMGWCIDCHRRNNATQDCAACHY
jgi:Cytochrome c7 and related cytochrome c